MRSPKRPLVSVLMPCRDGARTVAAAISSVQNQSLSDWELLIADDGSRDESQSIVRQLSAQDRRIKLLAGRGAAKGAAAARNHALAKAQGRYIAFLDADDLWMSEKLKHQLTFMELHRAAFTCTNYVVRRHKRRDYIRSVPEQITRKTLLRGNRIGCLTAIYDTGILGKQPMPEAMRRHDYALWLHLLRLTPFANGIPEPLAVHHRQHGSLSANPWTSTRATFHMLRSEAGLSLPVALKSTAYHVARRTLLG